MAPKRERPSTPPPRRSNMSPPPATPSTPSRPSMPRPASNMKGTVLGSRSVLVPPSPGFSEESALAGVPFNFLNAESEPIKKRKLFSEKPNEAGVMKPQTKLATGAIAKLVDVTTHAQAAGGKDAVDKVFRFMDLPGEVRNLVYKHSLDDSRQALLVHRPRMASLRTRTRLDRSRPLTSDLKDKELSSEIGIASDGKANKPVPRESFRPFFGLTQVCRQIRAEYRPIFLRKQEFGMDLTETVEYLRTFYSDAPSHLANLNVEGGRDVDMPFTGNLTIAVGDKPSLIEQHPDGVEILPLLDLWANSFRMEAGFGRYMKQQYIPEKDGEAKDLYRLFGRRVLPRRNCSQMNPAWRTILRSRALASITIHRKPADVLVSLATLINMPPNRLPRSIRHAILAGIQLPDPVLVPGKPYFHILFRPERAEPWMTGLVSAIPQGPDWLVAHGFGGMEHFDIKVGVAPPGKDSRFSC